MRSPIIALSASLCDNGCVSVNEAYLKSVFKAGGIPALLYPSTDKSYIGNTAKQFDGFIFCGGGDIDPIYYGEKKRSKIKNVCSFRDEFEYALFREVYSSGKPIFGICRGMQIINVFLGGSLHQDIGNHIQHEERHICTHRVNIHSGSMLSNILCKENIEVNSFHHQAVKKLAEGLECDAESDDGYIEAYHQEGHKFLLCVQWHPEACYGTQESSARLFGAFVRACDVK